MSAKIKYIIMCAGKGTRWNDYLGVPKHLVTINGETLLGRTTRLLKQFGITDYLITTRQPELYKPYGTCVPQQYNDCEIDRFDEKYVDGPVCYLYGDVYYTEEALQTIINTPVNDILFFGHAMEIFAIKIKDLDLFFSHKKRVKKLYMAHKINRCIGWEIYRSLHKIPWDQHIINYRYVYILDGTDDIDYPHEYEAFKERLEKK